MPSLRDLDCLQAVLEGQEAGAVAAVRRDLVCAVNVTNRKEVYTLEDEYQGPPPTSDPFELFPMVLEDYAVRYEAQMPPQVTSALVKAAAAIRDLNRINKQYDELSCDLLAGVEAYLVAEASSGEASSGEEL